MSLKPKIILLTGPVHSGKSNSLLNWAKMKREQGARIGGLTNPSQDGEKWFISAEFESSRKMNATDDEPAVRIGKYRFSAAAFAWARELLQPELGGRYDYFLIDEIGKLELKNIGLEPAVKGVFEFFQNNNETTIVAIVRESLLEDVIQHYGLEKFKVITKDELTHI